MEKDNIPRYVPDRVITLYGLETVLRIQSYPPNTHPESPLIPDCTAIELTTQFGTRWYGVDSAWINSELRFVIKGFPSNFSELSKWEKVNENQDL